MLLVIDLTLTPEEKNTENSSGLTYISLLWETKTNELYIENNHIYRQERGAYMNRAALAHRSPHEYFSIAVDGMDQSKTEIPNSKLRFKALDTAWKLKIHIVGTMVHGRHPICFIDYHQHPHDSNLVANIILQV